MADVALSTAPSAPAEQTGAVGAVLRWLTQSREGKITIWIVLASSALTAALIIHAFYLPILSAIDARAYFIAATTLLWLPLLLLLMDSSDTLASGPGLALPVATTLILLSIVVFILTPWGQSLLRPDGHTISVAVATAICAFLGLAFIPRLANALEFARAKGRELAARERLHVPGEADGDSSEVMAKRQEQADAEAVIALAMTIAVFSIIVIAYVAGRWSDKGGLANNAGIAIAIATIVVFGFYVFVDRLPDFPPVRLMRQSIKGASKPFGWIAQLYNGIDWGFVRLFAHAAGMGHRTTTARYGVLIGTELGLCLLAWFLPPPLGLLPAALGFILAFSISRLWGWVEDDRALAILTRFSVNAPIKVGFREDYRDETLLGFMFALVLIPMAFMQMHVGRVFGVPLFVNAPESGIGGWIGYLGFELAKALPIVDWADIYGLSEGADVMSPTRPIGMHTVFAARAVVDLVLVSALLQAINISARNRQQKTLYALKQIRRLDEIIERRELRRILSRPVSLWFANDVIDFRHYDRARLNELRNTKNEKLQTFVERILKESGETVDKAIVVLTRLAANRAPLPELENALAAVKSEHANRTNVVSPADLVEVMDNLRHVEGLKPFKEAVVDFALTLSPIEEIVDFLDLIMFGKGRDRFKYTRLHAARALADVSPRIGDATKLRELVDKLDAEQDETFGARSFIPKALRQALQARLHELLK